MRWPVGTHPELDLLRAFADGKLGSAARDAVARHLVDCRQCAESLRLSGTIIEPPTMRERPALPPPLPPPLAKTLIENAGLPREVETIGWADNPGTLHAGEPPPSAVPEVEILPPKELREHPRYRAIRRLGGGGMGDVFLAEHTRMDRRVAIKVINRRLLDQPAALARFFREVKAAARLEHPNIVRAYDADEAGPLHFLVMEYVEGDDLAAVVKRRGAMPFDEACRLVRQAALGLQHAHEHGMVHRDIKPHNLMLTAEGQVKVLDFGLARFARETGDEQLSDSGTSPAAADGLTGTGMMMGTADYIAPEQSVNARDADIRADIYSLGCTLYHLAAGRPPFGGSFQDKIRAHHEILPARLSSIRREFPEALDRIVERMMAKKPADRYQTPADVIAALSPFTKPLEFRRSQGLAKEKPPSESKLPATLYEGRIKLDNRSPTAPIHTGKTIRTVPVGNGRRGRHFSPAINFFIGLGILGVIVGAIIVAYSTLSPSGEVKVTWNGDAGPLSIERLDGTRVRLVYPGTTSFWLAEGDYLVGWTKPTQEWLVQPASFRLHPNKVVTLQTLSAEEQRRKSEMDAKAAEDARIAAKAAADAAAEDARLKKLWAGVVVAGQMGEQNVFDLEERGDIRGVAVTADGKCVITCGDNLARCRFLKNGETVWQQTLGKAGERLSCVATSPYGKWVAIGSSSGMVHVLEAATGKRSQILAGESPVRSLCFSFDSRRILSTDDTAARLWDMADGKRIRTFEGHDGPVLAGAFSRGDTKILTGGQDGTLRLFDCSDGVLLHTMARHKGAVRSVACSPDDDTALSGGDDLAVRHWDLDSGREIRALPGHRSPVTAVAFPSGGKLGVSVGEDNAVRVWLLPARRQLVQFDGHTDRVHCLSLSKVEPLLVTAGLDRTLRVWLLPNVDPRR